MSSEELETNLRRFLACAAARYKLTKTCYGGIPDPGDHEGEAQKNINGAKNCREELKKCRQPQTSPKPAPAQSPAPITTIPDPQSPSWWESFPWWIFSIPGKALDPLGDFFRGM